MNTLYNYLNSFNFFTITKTAFTVWFTILLFSLIMVIAALIGYMLCESWLVYYLQGKSADDVKVQNAVADNNMREEICRHIAVYFGLLAVCTIGTFFAANFNFITGMVIEIFCAVLLVGLCVLNIIGAYGFNQDLKNGTVNY